MINETEDRPAGKHYNEKPLNTKDYTEGLLFGLDTAIKLAYDHLETLEKMRIALVMLAKKEGVMQ